LNQKQQEEVMSKCKWLDLPLYYLTLINRILNQKINIPFAIDFELNMNDFYKDFLFIFRMMGSNDGDMLNFFLSHLHYEIIFN